MNIAMTHQDDILTVRFDGALDYSSTTRMEDLLTDLGAIKAAKVVFDLAQVARVDSVGLGLLHMAKDDIVKLGARLVLRGANGTVRRLFELTDCAHVFDIE